ncbi:hypothetical protein PM082_012456 [Marasmius tenuissimus]|nr:hypothetical protein PM082_012456 [Marasmius tenuissimus]
MAALLLMGACTLVALELPLVLADAATDKQSLAHTRREKEPRQGVHSTPEFHVFVQLTVYVGPSDTNFPARTFPVPSETSTDTSTTSTATPLIVFTSPSSALATCQSSELSWIHSGPNVRINLGITNAGVTQDPPPSSGTSSSTLAKRADPVTSVASILAEDIDGSQGKYRWDRVNVSQGWYILVAIQTDTDTFLGRSKASLFVRNGTDTSCVGGPPGSLSSPTRSSADPQATPQPSQTSTSIGSHSRSSIPAIIGGVVGGVVLIMLILYLRRRKAEKREIAPDSAPRSLNPLDFPSPAEKSSHFLTLRRKARPSTKNALDPRASIQERQPNSPIIDLEPIQTRVEEPEEDQPPPSPPPSHHDFERTLSQPLPPPSPASDPWNGLGDIHPQIRLQFEAMARRMARLEAEMAPPTYVSSTSYQHQEQ